MKKVNENYISAFGHLINIKDIPLFDSTDDPEQKGRQDKTQAAQITWI